MRIEFSVREGRPPPASGFDLGDIDVEGNWGAATSRGHRPDQGMMIHLAVAELLDTLRALVAGRRPGKAVRREFVGADSSFTLDFTLTREGRLVTAQGGQVLDESPAGEALREVGRAAEAFAAAHLPTLPEDDAARGDLEAALRAFRGVAAGVGE
ncbi:hypothetical protein RM780_10550 [Streptomyces sp. DSM 44917]|uniref:Uncharacterized protein n=1 Tax=Streptomyces boetiae TaxID=3075541 RepID=A0ABU2L7T8_9ACTN|nr:hypothetical protein [Streptomyces sp. DSM 44917]MDT0307402.1 hypothetical protein [Streptomyces sp. DSM 44917]